MNIVLFVPLKDEAKLLATVRSKFGKDFKLGSDGLCTAAAMSRRLLGDVMYSVFGFGPDRLFAVLGDKLLLG